MVETDNMADSSHNVEDEVGRVLEQAKELHDSAASLISRTASDEQSLRQRALSLESSIRRLRSLLNSLLSKKLLDSKLAEKVYIFINFYYAFDFKSIVLKSTDRFIFFILF